MRQAIVTKYLGPTNHRGARVKATAQAGSVTVEWDHALSVDENHDRAADAFVAKFAWVGWEAQLPKLHAGALPDGTGNVYVFEE
jgi:hypothetical protein